MAIYTATQIKRIGGNSWIQPGTGQERVYLNDWAELIGLDVEYYKSGNICAATLNGEHISNAQARRILYAKVWWQDGQILVSGNTELSRHHIPALNAGIAAAVAAADARWATIPAGVIVEGHDWRGDTYTWTHGCGVVGGFSLERESSERNYLAHRDLCEHQEAEC